MPSGPNRILAAVVVLGSGDSAEQDFLLHGGAPIRRELVANHLVFVGPGHTHGGVNDKAPGSGELRVDGDTEEATLAARGDVDLSDRGGHEGAAGHQANPSRAFGDEPITAGQKGDSPGHLQIGDHGLGLDGHGSGVAVAGRDQRAMGVRLRGGCRGGTATGHRKKKDQPSALGHPVRMGHGRAPGRCFRWLSASRALAVASPGGRIQALFLVPGFASELDAQIVCRLVYVGFHVLGPAHGAHDGDVEAIFVVGVDAGGALGFGPAGLGCSLRQRQRAPLRPSAGFRNFASPRAPAAARVSALRSRTARRDFQWWVRRSAWSAPAA